MKVIVTGGAGYIGSVCAEELLRQGHSVTVIDNLSTGRREAVPDGVDFHEMDICEWLGLRKLFAEESFDAVFHFAAMALVGESMFHPSAYYDVNVNASITLIDAVIAAKIPRFIFSSSAAVYGNPLDDELVLTEDHPTYPINPYGETKLAFERLLDWYSRAYGLNVCCFRYFNASGASSDHGENRQHETHLIPLLFQAAAKRRELFTIYGTDYPTADGTCVRDFVHVKDIAQAHILALKLPSSHSFRVYNIGTGDGHSVRRVIARTEEAIGLRVPFQCGPRRLGDPVRLVADPSKLMIELGWTPQHSSLDNIIETAWKWKTRNQWSQQTTSR